MLNKERILSYKDLVNIPVGENNEPLVDVRLYDKKVIAQYKKTDMLPYTGDTILVRDSLAKKLAKANEVIFEKHGFCLKIVYGYRHPDIQKKYFESRRENVKSKNPSLTGEDIDALTHNFVAVPVVAGHPTGGAIDITVIDSNGKELDMGTDIADFEEPEKIKTFSNEISKIQKDNRLLLHDVLVKEGFAPFYGEWWHFSYGDREWACFYQEQKTLYSPINFKLL